MRFLHLKEVKSPYIFLFPYSFLPIYQDKWRNLSVSNAAQGSKEKVRNAKMKAMVPAAIVSTPNASPAPSLRQCAASDAVMDDASQNAQDVKHAPRYAFF